MTGIPAGCSCVFLCALSAVPAYTELAWMLTCVTLVGWLERMTQYKAKTAGTTPSTVVPATAANPKPHYPSLPSNPRWLSIRCFRSRANRSTPAKIDFGSKWASAMTSGSSPPVSHWLSQSEVSE